MDCIALQAPLSVGCSRQEYWSGLPFPSPGDLPDSGIEPGSPALQADSSLSEPSGKPPSIQFSSVQLLSRVRLFATPWIAAHRASLSITISQSSPRLTSIKSVMPSSHLILVVPFSSCPQSLPASESFPMSQLFARGGQSTGVSALASVLPKNTQGWSPLGWTNWKFLQSKGLARVFSNTTAQKYQFFGTQLSSQSNSHTHTWPLEKPLPWLDRPLLAK